MFNGRKVLATITAFIFLLGSMPFTMGFGGIVRMSSNLDGFEFYNHTAPAGHPAQAFASRTVPIDNPNFAEQGPYVFTSTTIGWTPDPDRTSSNAIGGVLNVHNNFNTFLSNNNLSHVPFLQQNPNTDYGTDDTMVLVISSRNAGLSAVHGYTSNQTLNFHADGYFIVEVGFYKVADHTSGVGNTSEIILIPTAPLHCDEIETSILVRQQVEEDGSLDRSSWQTATFFIQTDRLSGAEFNLGLYLGTHSGVASGGVVYYDNVRARSVTYSEFNLELSRNRQLDAGGVRRSEINLNRDDQFTDALAIGNFVRTHDPLGQGEAGHFFTNAVPQILNFERATVAGIEQPLAPLWHHASELSRSVMLFSAVDGNASMKLDGGFEIERNISYMINFYSLGSGSLRIYDPTDPDDVPEAVTLFDTTLSTHSNYTPVTHSRNGWTLNTIFITGEAFEDITVEIEFWIGSEDHDATGWLLVDNFEIRRVAAPYKTLHAETANVQTVAMNVLEPTPGIANGFFNLGSVEDVNRPFPLRASDWNLEMGDEELARSGIVNIQPEHWARFAGETNYGNAFRPDPVQARDWNNNVFMMQNLGPTYQKLSSNLFSLTTGGYNIVSFDVSSIHRPSDGMHLLAVIEFSGESDLHTRELATIDLGRVRNARGTSAWTLSNWTRHNFAIRGAQFTTHEVRISFLMGAPGRCAPAATAFIDNVRLNTQESPPSGSNFKIVGFDDPSLFFVASSAEGSTSERITTSISNGNLRIETHHNNLYSDAPNTSIRGNPMFAERLDPGMYYEYTIRARLSNLEHRAKRVTDEDDLPIDEPDHVDENYWGISITLEGFEGGFVHLKPEYMRHMPTVDHNYWVALTFFIKTERAEDLIPIITFGNEWRAVAGAIEIQSISLRQSNEDEWAEARDKVNQAERDEEHINIRILTEPGFVDDGGEEEGGERDPIPWMIIIPSIVMAVCLLLAVSLVLWRKRTFFRHIGKKHTSYKMDDAGVRGAVEIKDLKAKAVANPDDATENVNPADEDDLD